MHTIRILASLAAVVLFNAVIAAQASAAPELNAEKYPVKVVATNVTVHGLAVPQVATICKKVTFTAGEEGAAELASSSATFTLHPNFAECKATDPGGTGPATWTTVGCNFRFHVVKPGESTGTVDIVCAAGQEISIAAAIPTGCTLRLPSQNTVGTVVYKNEPAGEVTIKMELSHMKTKISEGCGTGKVEAEGEYREGEETGGIVTLAPAGHPAISRAKGKFKNGAKEETDPIEIGANEPHWYENHVPLGPQSGGPGEEGVATLMWGTLVLSSPGTGAVECQTEWIGDVYNPEGAGTEARPGETKLAAFRTSDCISTQCETTLKSKLEVAPEGLGVTVAGGVATEGAWEGKLATGSGKTRLNLGNKSAGSPTQIKWHVVCPKTTLGEYNKTWQGELSPELENGTQIGIAPTKLTFNSGELEVVGTSEKGSVTNKLKMFGFEGSDIISSKNP